MEIPQRPFYDWAIQIKNLKTLTSQTAIININLLNNGLAQKIEASLPLPETYRAILSLISNNQSLSVMFNKYMITIFGLIMLELKLFWIIMFSLSKAGKRVPPFRKKTQNQTNYLARSLELSLKSASYKDI